MPLARVTLPQNVLSHVYRLANARTQTRLRATSKNMRRDPLMPAPAVRQGFAFGTGGKLQKLYNQLPKRFRALENKMRQFKAWYTPYIVDDKDHSDVLRHIHALFNESMSAYKQAVKAGTGHVQVRMESRSTAPHVWTLFPEMIRPLFTNAARQKLTSRLKGRVNIRYASHAAELWRLSEYR